MSLKVPPTRYVDVGGAEVAYKIYGDGPIDILYCYGLGSHVDMMFEEPIDLWVPALATFGRLIAFDRRGTGASDALATSAMPTWEEGADDIAAVLDAAGSQRAVLFAAADAGPIALRFAATRPDRVAALILENTTARFLAAADYPPGVDAETIEGLIDLCRRSWGTTEFVQFINPSWEAGAAQQWQQEAVARRLRASATPRTAAAQLRYITMNLDVRDSLDLVQAPTLVLHTADNPFIGLSQGEFLAQHIGDARLVVLPGADVAVIESGITLAIEAIAEFLTGERPDVVIDRILTTIMFTDIVDSTGHVQRLGDGRWARLLNEHDRVVREQLRRYAGREIETAGDGFLVSFDGPGRGLRCASAIVDATRDLGVAVRVGVHTGECEVRAGGLAGMAVHVAARVGATAQAGQILASATVHDLVLGSGIEFDDAGQHLLKGIPGTWSLFAVRSASP